MDVGVNWTAEANTAITKQTNSQPPYSYSFACNIRLAIRLVFHGKREIQRFCRNGDYFFAGSPLG